LPKRFCVNTKGLNPEERKELATDLNKLVEAKKAEFEKQRQESKENPEEDSN
jgi:diadenosine tetraphosphate (Ap4A) HIT family hydrolase